MKNEELVFTALKRSALFLLLFVVHSSLGIRPCRAQSGGKYDYYRYLQNKAVEVDPLGVILGRMSAHYEMRLDPNFSRTYEFVYHRNVTASDTAARESDVSIGAMERIYLVDNASMLGQYAGVGLGLGLIGGSNLSIRLTAEIGYKWCFGGGKGHYFVEPKFLMDAYLLTHKTARQIFPLIAIPFGYAWW